MVRRRSKKQEIFFDCVSSTDDEEAPPTLRSPWQSEEAIQIERRERKCTICDHRFSPSHRHARRVVESRWNTTLVCYYCASGTARTAVAPCEKKTPAPFSEARYPPLGIPRPVAVAPVAAPPRPDPEDVQRTNEFLRGILAEMKLKSPPETPSSPPSTLNADAAVFHPADSCTHVRTRWADVV